MRPPSPPGIVWVQLVTHVATSYLLASKVGSIPLPPMPVPPVLVPPLPPVAPPPPAPPVPPEAPPPVPVAARPDDPVADCSELQPWNMDQATTAKTTGI